MGGGYVNIDCSKKNQSSQSMYFVVIASFAILSYTARITARKIQDQTSRQLVLKTWNEQFHPWNGASLE